MGLDRFRRPIIGVWLIAALLLSGCSARMPPSSGVTERGGAAVPEVSPTPDLEAADRAAELENLDAETEIFSNTIRWATASEQENFGYDVYRAEHPEGPFERINVEVIEGGGTVDDTRRYEFEDLTIDPRKTYYYYVESISFSGVREAFTPVGKAPPKIDS